MRIQHCEPHLHDTYTIAYMKCGTAAVNTGSHSWSWEQGGYLLGNPYEVHWGGSVGGSIDYQVIYPGTELMLEAARIPSRTGLVPRLSCTTRLSPDVAWELAQILSTAVSSGTDGSGMGGSSIEQELIDFFRRNAQAMSLSVIEVEEVAHVSEACRILQDALDSQVSWPMLAEHIGISRCYFSRLFHRVTGLAPNVYYRQLRLSKARRMICQGVPLAEAAFAAGFADQAHLTREFKRSFGSTPGALAKHVATRAALPLD